jgi:hypothetical protein
LPRKTTGVERKQPKRGYAAGKEQFETQQRATAEEIRQAREEKKKARDLRNSSRVKPFWQS